MAGKERWTEIVQMETKQAESGLEGKVISIEKKSSAGEQKGEIRCEQRNGIPIKTWKRTGKATSGCRMPYDMASVAKHDRTPMTNHQTNLRKY
jgi:hypothetical protein